MRLPNDNAARAVISRSILTQGIYELWGQGATYPALHASVKAQSSAQWPQYENNTFSFRVERYRGVTAPADQVRAVIESFSYLGFKGAVRIKNPQTAVRVFEDYELDSTTPRYLYLGRFIAESGRDARHTYDLKKRHYISTTSMDAELALLTANIALAAPGKLFYDPFMGTGGFPVACAHYGAVVCGSDIDGRAIRGTGGSARRGQTGKKDVGGNFAQYGLSASYLGGFVSDLTNTPLRLGAAGYLDGIVCDPPYGIREGLKVLGSREALLDVERQTHADQYQLPGYIPPKRPYSFTALLDDILAFAATTLVPGGCLSMWMPMANDENIELLIPAHPCLRLDSVCVQAFNKWSRRLLTYRRLRDDEVPEGALEAMAKREYEKGTKASDLNDFRRKYFQGFREFEDMKKEFIRMKVEAGVEKAGEERVAEGEKEVAEKEAVEEAVEKETAKTAEAAETGGQTQS